MLRLTEDKQSVIDDRGNTVYIARERDGKTVYVPAPSVEMEGKGKVCLEFKIEPKKVCISWNGHKCIEWGGIDTEVCVKWSS